jgi:hypothetical protein
MSRPGRTASVLLMAALGALGPGCNDLENRLKTCRDFRVDLVNALPSEGAVHIAQEGEALSNDVTLLPARAGGSSRTISVCAERGDRKKFIAAYGIVQVDTATCVVSHATEELEVVSARVAWTNQGLVCQDW